MEIMGNVLMGIGNELKGDDGIGNILAREFSGDGWLSIACETVPENFTGVIRRERPNILVIVDAADMGLAPGDMRIIPDEKLGSAGFGTHGMPLSSLVSVLDGIADDIIFIGVQPKKAELGDGLSHAVELSKKRLIRIIRELGWGSIERL